MIDRVPRSNTKEPILLISTHTFRNPSHLAGADAAAAKLIADAGGHAGE